MTARRAVAAAVVVVALVIVWGASPASAHAVLVEAAPTAESILPSGPAIVELRFDESVDAALGGIRVFGPDGSRVDNGRATTSDGARRVRTPVRATAIGTYTVAWRVVSADNHPLAGSYVVSVRTRSGVSSVDAAGRDPAAVACGGVARTAAYGFAAVAFGALLVAARTARLLAASVDTHRRIRLVGAVSSGAAAVAVAAGLWAQVAIASGRSLPGATDLVLDAVTSTRLGHTAVVRLVLLTVAAVAAVAPRRSAMTMAAAAAAGLAVIAPAFAGHAVTAATPAFAVTVDAVHLAAGGVWLGALAAYVTGRRSGDNAQTLARHVSSTAAPAAILVVASGATSAWIQAGSIDALIDTSWGRLIGIKTAGFAVLVAIGWFSRRRLVPVVTRLGTLAEVVKIELAVATVVLAATALAVNRAPGRSELDRPVADQVTTSEGVVSLTISPARVGLNEAHLYFLDGNGLRRPVDAVEATIATAQVPARKIRLVPVDASHVSAYDLTFPAPGTWTMTVTGARGDRTETATSTFTVR